MVPFQESNLPINPVGMQVATGVLKLRRLRLGYL